MDPKLDMSGGITQEGCPADPPHPRTTHMSGAQFFSIVFFSVMHMKAAFSSRE